MLHVLTDGSWTWMIPNMSGVDWMIGDGGAKMAIRKTKTALYPLAFSSKLFQLSLISELSHDTRTEFLENGATDGKRSGGNQCGFRQ